MAKTRESKQWETDHPDDRPCPSGPTAAKAWRIKRGITKEKRHQELWKKYDAVMAEKWAHEAMAEKQAKA